MNVSSSNFSTDLLVQSLQQKIRQVEVAGRNDDGSVISSGTTAMDALLPAGGYGRGTIVHWCGPSGSGTEFLSLLAAKSAAEAGGAIVVIDEHQQFYPPAARSLGISLGNLIVLRGGDLFWAIEQSLQCPAVAVVWGSLPRFKTPQLATRWQRRFQLAAEASGCCGMFIRHQGAQPGSYPIGRTATPSAPESSAWAEVQWQLRPLRNANSSGDTRRIRSTLVRCRGGTAGQTVDLEINNITGNVQTARSSHATPEDSTSHSLPVAAQLANPAVGRRAARA